MVLRLPSDNMLRIFRSFSPIEFAPVHASDFFFEGTILMREPMLMVGLIFAVSYAPSEVATLLQGFTLGTMHISDRQIIYRKIISR